MKPKSSAEKQKAGWRSGTILSMAWTFLAFIIFACGSGKCGSPSPTGSWTWVVEFAGIVLAQKDSLPVENASVTVNGKWKTQSGSGGFFIRDTSCEEDPSSAFEKITVKIQKAGYVDFVRDYALTEVTRDVAGNELSTGGTKWILPKIYLEERVLDLDAVSACF